MTPSVTVISLGGSIIAPKGLDVPFLKGFASLVESYLAADASRKLIIVCGGGSLAREYQAALREASPGASGDDQDWVGIAATRVNGELVRRILRPWCIEDLVTDPTAVTVFAGRVMVAAGWKPGFSTDNDAVVLAQRFSASLVVNLSNIAKVYSADPRTHPGARALEKLSWKEMLEIVGGEWTPGKNTPFDATAARAAAASRIPVVFAAGGNLDNLSKILNGGAYVGTTIGPD
ncbi:MAG TPA: UMP kinase [Spirochaetia bacterium]|nr:UMP kinase [Spirochaetia bacterium]